jgi:hypothetical protein
MKNQTPKSIEELTVKNADYSISAAHPSSLDDEIFVILPPSNLEHNGIVQVGGTGSATY